MSFHRRQRQISPKEALETAIKEATPHWIGPEPLMTALPPPGGSPDDRPVVFPLNPAFTAQPWLVAFLDPFAYSSDVVIRQLEDWSRRYEMQRLGCIIVFRDAYTFLGELGNGSHWRTHWTARVAAHPAGQLAIVLDKEGRIARGFGVADRPELVVLMPGGATFRARGPGWFEGFERKLQELFRQSDPGLPLLGAMPAPAELASDLPPRELDCSGGPDASLRGRLTGAWERGRECLVTRDPRAALSFHVEGSRLGLVASSMGESAELIVELTGDFRKDLVTGDDLTAPPPLASGFVRDLKELRQGRTRLLQEPRTYRLFRNLPVDRREITLRWTGDSGGGIALFSVRSAWHPDGKH